jgi:hypothetical protein
MPTFAVHSTLPALVERALAGNPRPLEFFLREQSHLPGTRANLELVHDLSFLLAALVKEQPEQVRALLDYLISDDRHKVVSNTPEEFVMLCGVVALGACAAARSIWRSEVFELLGQYACSTCWRVREGTAIAFQRLLAASPKEAICFLSILAKQGNYFQQRAAIAALAEPPLLYVDELLTAALALQRVILDRMRSAPATERKREDFRALRQALGYTVSVITAAAPEEGFAIMRTCATWNDSDITWVLRENLKKKRLAKFPSYMYEVKELLT